MPVLAWNRYNSVPPRLGRPRELSERVNEDAGMEFANPMDAVQLAGDDAEEEES